jgi:TRAP-type mannitol/chloroaromatic compound transport system permease small subunit
MKGNILSYLLLVFNRIIEALNAIGTVWVAAMMVLICGDIFGRALFNSPIIGVPEIVRVSVVGIVWLQMAHTLKIGGHLRSNIILDRLSIKWQNIIEVLGCILGILVFSLAAYTSWDVMIEGWRIKEFEGELPVRVPVYPIRTIVLIGTFLTMVQFVVILCQNIFALFCSSAQEEK